MADRWIIHSRNRTLGPWSNDQVREELRLGKIDPFDMVSKEHSNLKRPLVEIDEIFQSTRVQMAEVVQDRATIERSQGGDQGTVISPLAAGAEAVSKVDLRMRPRQFEALAAEAKVEMPVPKQGSRSYMVTDSTGRRMGPMSSSELMDFWQRGMFDSRAIVQRRDQEKKITIEKFISFYQRSAPSGIAFIMKTNPAVRLRQGVPASSQGPMTWIAILISVVAIGFLGFTLYQNRDKLKLSKVDQSKISKPKHRFDLKANEELIKKRSPSTKESENLPTAKLTLEPTNISAKSQVNASPGAKKSVSKQPSKKSSKSPKKPKYKAPKRLATKTPLSQGSSIIKAPTPLNRASGNSSNRLPNVKSSASPKAKPAQWSDGATVTLSGYKFSKDAVNQCEMKCKILLNGAGGAVTAVFFKQAHGGAFAAKPGVISVTGIMRNTGSGWQMIVSRAE
jgi:hypothetical protein